MQTRRQRLLDLLRAPREEGWSPKDLAEALDADEAAVLEDLRHLTRSLRRTREALLMLPARCQACGWEPRGEEPRSPAKCPRCHATGLLPPRFQVGPR